MLPLEQRLRRFDGFRAFPELDVRALVRAMVVEHYPDGHVFVAEGAKGRAVFVVLQGEVDVLRYDGATGATLRLKTLRDGELFGLLSLIEHLPAAATCVARGEVSAAHLSASAFSLLADSAAPIARHFQYLVAQQLARDITDRNRALRALLG